MMLPPLNALRLLLARDGTELELQSADRDERERAWRERLATIDEDPGDRVVNLYSEAETARYANGKSKRHRYPAVDLARFAVVIVLHQTGFEWSESNPKTAEISGHTVIGAAATRFHLHPLTTRLIHANRLNRSPFHAIGIEVMGNFEGIDGSGRWYMPERFGRGRATDAQIRAIRREILRICDEVERLGGEVVAIVPHRSSGYNWRNGRPNRQIDPGSRVWALCGEWSGAVLGLDVPGPGWKIRGLEVPEEWHGSWWPQCTDLLGVDGRRLAA